MTRPVTTHVIRKTARTLIGQENPRFAVLQLGITDKIYERRYNQPLLPDRLDRRDLLPGSEWKPKTPEELAGAAYFDLTAGKINRENFDDAVAKARELRTP